MSNETIAIAAVCATLLAATVGMGAFTFNSISGVRTEVVVLRTDVAELHAAEVRSDVADLRVDVADLRERMARLEGLFEGFTGRAGESGA